MELTRHDDHFKNDVCFTVRIHWEEWAACVPFDPEYVAAMPISGLLMVLSGIARAIEDARQPVPAGRVPQIEGPPEEVEAEIVEPS